jgi:NAD(P)-dependent dehydrogenase (short-subunit alcohol dehydrogenase family)
MLTTPFSAQTTADEVLDGVDLTGRRAIVTGGASGIGWQTVRVLAQAGAQVTIAARDVASGAEAARRIPGATPRVAPLDLGDLESVHRFIDGWDGPLDILVANAGIMAVPELVKIGPGWESQFAVNQMGHAALMLGLHHALQQAVGARVVVVSSSAHLLSPVEFDDINFDARAYDPWLAYGQSKTAEILFASAAAERWRQDGISVNFLHPGTIMTNLQRHLDDDALAWVGAKDESGNTLDVPPGWKTPAQGAATTALLAGSPLVEGVTGRYFEDLQEAEVVDDPDPRGSGLARWAADPGSIERMWTVTLQLLGR